MAEPSPVFVFDAYGTLFDVHSAVREHADGIGASWPALSETWRAKQLEYTWIYAGVGAHVPFREVTRASLHYALAVCGMDASVAPRLLDAYQRLQAFPEVREVLERLKAGGTKLAILSNADTDMLDDLVLHAGLDGVFDAVISARVAGSFKPVPQVYALATEVFAVPPQAIRFVSSNRWDVAGAKAFGFKTVWINRRALPDEYPDLPADQTVSDLTLLFA